MARVAGEIFKARPVADAGRRFAEVDATAWTEGAFARNRSDGGLGEDCRRIHFSPFRASGVTGRNSLRARAPTGFALRTGAGFQDRHLAKVEAALRRESHQRR